MISLLSLGVIWLLVTNMVGCNCAEVGGIKVVREPVCSFLLE